MIGKFRLISYPSMSKRGGHNFTFRFSPWFIWLFTKKNNKLCLKFFHLIYFSIMMFHDDLLLDKKLVNFKNISNPGKKAYKGLPSVLVPYKHRGGYLPTPEQFLTPWGPAKVSFKKLFCFLAPCQSSYPCQGFARTFLPKLYTCLWIKL